MENKSYLCGVQHIEDHEIAKSSWNFFIRPLYASHQNKQSAIFEDIYEFKSRNLPSQCYPHFVIQHKASDEYPEWVMWKKKKNKLNSDSKGFWKVLNIHSKTISIEHLNCIKTILRDKLLAIMEYIGFNLQNKHQLNFIFINEINLNSLLQSSTEFTDSENFSDFTPMTPSHSGEEMKINIDYPIEESKSNKQYSEYKLAFWNGHIFGATSMSLYIPSKCDNKLSKRQFMHIPMNNDINWSWYNNAEDEWQQYSNQTVILSLEASYQALICDMYPESDQFNYCVLPSLSRLILNAVRKRKTFMFRVISDNPQFEIIAMDNNGYEQYVANIKRDEEKANDEDTEETRCIRQNWYSPFIVKRYIKYYVQYKMKGDSIIPMDIAQLCHKYYFQNVVKLQFAQCLI